MVMRFATGVPVLAGMVMAALAGPADARSGAQQPDGTQRQATSPYADGTGNSAVDTLNSGQLDRNYTGPWHQVPPHPPGGRPIGGPIGLDRLPELQPAPPGPPPAPAAGAIPDQVAPPR